MAAGAEDMMCSSALFQLSSPLSVAEQRLMMVLDEVCCHWVVNAEMCLCSVYASIVWYILIIRFCVVQQKSTG